MMDTKEKKTSTLEAYEDMRKLVGKKLNLSDGAVVHFIGENRENGDFFWVSQDGEAKILYHFEILSQGKKRRINIFRFMLADEGLILNSTQWRRKHRNFKLVGNIYERKNCLKKVVDGGIKEEDIRR